MIEVLALTKIFGQRAAIKNINFKVNQGEIVGFLGPNGAGKSTTMKILTGFMPASSGTAKVAGFDIFEETMEVKKNVGYLPENPPVYFDMVVEDYLKYAARLHFVPRVKLKSAIDAALEKTALTDVRKRIIGNLSKGYRQRVGIAQAIVHDPKVLILDEPTVGLDPVQIIEIRELIKSLGGAHTVILSSHILQEVAAICSRIIVIDKGVIIAEDSIDQLTTRMMHGLEFQMKVQNASSNGIKVLESIPGVKSVVLAGELILIEVFVNQGELRPRLLEVAIKEGMGVLEFTRQKLSLEEIFLQLTHHENTVQDYGVQK